MMLLAVAAQLLHAVSAAEAAVSSPRNGASARCLCYSKASTLLMELEADTEVNSMNTYTHAFFSAGTVSVRAWYTLC